MSIYKDTLNTSGLTSKMHILRIFMVFKGQIMLQLNRIFFKKEKMFELYDAIHKTRSQKILIIIQHS